MSFFEGLVVTYQLTKTWGSHNYCFAVETITFLTNDICRWLRHQKNRSPQRNGQRSTQMSYFPLCQLADFAPFTMAYQNPYGSGFFCIPCKNSTEGGFTDHCIHYCRQDFGNVWDIPNGSILEALVLWCSESKTRKQQQQQQRQPQQQQPQSQQPQRQLEPRMNPLFIKWCFFFLLGIFHPSYPFISSHFLPSPQAIRPGLASTAHPWCEMGLVFLAKRRPNSEIMAMGLCTPKKVASPLK